MKYFKQDVRKVLSGQQDNDQSTIIDVLHPAFGRMLLTNATALYAGMLCTPRVVVLVIAWVAVKFGINTTSVTLKIGKIFIFNATRVVFIPNFTAIPMLFPVNTILDDFTLPNIL